MLTPPKPYAKNCKLLKEIGINALFADDTIMSDGSFLEAARQNNLKLFLVMRVFLLETKNEPLMGICEDGTQTFDKTEEGEWVKFACPNNKTHRHAVLARVKKAIKQIQPDVLSIDFIRYFVFWERVSPDMRGGPLPNSCFCGACMEKFQADTAIKIPGNIRDAREYALWIKQNALSQFTRWKCQVIAQMVDEIIIVGRQVKPDLLFNIHVVPWRQEDFEGGILSIAGQDLAQLGKKVNYLSPMCYSSMTGNSPEWVSSVVQDIKRTVPVAILPSIQVAKDYSWEKEYTLDDFEKALLAALQEPSQGVVFFEISTLLKDAQRLAIAKRILANTKKTPLTHH